MRSPNPDGYTSDEEFRNPLFNYPSTTEWHNKRQKRKQKKGCVRIREGLLKVLIVPPKPNYFLAHEMGLNSNCFCIGRFIIISLFFSSIDAPCHPPAYNCEFSLFLMAILFSPLSRGLHGKFGEEHFNQHSIVTWHLCRDALGCVSLFSSLAPPLSVSV